MPISQTFDQYLSMLLETDPDMAGELADARADLDQALRRERAERSTETLIGKALGYVRQRFSGGWLWQPVPVSSLAPASPVSGAKEAEPTARLDEATNQLVIDAGSRYAGGEALLVDSERRTIVSQVALNEEGRGWLAIPVDGPGFQIELIEPNSE